MSTTATETALERQVREEQEEHDLARNDGGLAANEQLQKEKLFELPPIKHDSTKPTMIHVVVSGPVPLDLSQRPTSTSTTSSSRASSSRAKSPST